jgi:hypothetical protein
MEVFEGFGEEDEVVESRFVAQPGADGGGIETFAGEFAGTERHESQGKGGVQGIDQLDVNDVLDRVCGERR